MKTRTRPPFRLRSPAMDVAETEQNQSFRHVAEAVQRVNDAIRRAVESGITVELERTSRCHSGRGHWGDQVAPTIPEK